MKILRTALASASIALLAGCAHETQVVVVDPAKQCEPPPALLQPCESASVLADGLSFGQLLDSYQADRQRLRQCAVQRDDLAKAIETCNAEIARHNAELQSKLKAP